MNERHLQDIKRHLQDEDAKERVRRDMQRGREEATVTIGRAARLFNFTENKLRDWEGLGLLKPLRSKDITGQRQYPPEELDKLAIIKELIEKGGFSPGSIPADVDKIWNAIASEQERALRDSRDKAERVPIEERVESAYKELFWRYYASHVLRLCLMLICEEIPSAPAGLVLPLENKKAISVRRPEDLQEIGESFIGWLGQTRSFYTFLDQALSFEYPSDYQILPLQEKNEEAPGDRTLIIVDRRARLVDLSNAIVETIRRLVAPLYENVQKWRSSFTQGMRDLLDPAFNSSPSSSDAILTGLADMVVRLGGKTVDGWDRWRFCCILLPKDPMLPLQQRSLIVRAQSKYAPHKVGVTTISPNETVIGLSLRAFQSGRVNYRPEVSKEDATIALREAEGSIRSAVAVPVGGENGPSVAVLYVVSDEVGAFSESDQRVLRMIGRIVEELIRTYYVRQQVMEDLGEMIKKPGEADVLLKGFLSENEFIRDVERLLIGIQARIKDGKTFGHGSVLPGNYFPTLGAEQLSEEVVSFIAVDIDNQTSLAIKYGEQMMRNLSRAVGLKLQRQLDVFFTKFAFCQLYHIYADRFYLLLNSVPLEQARKGAARLLKDMQGPYLIGASIAPTDPPMLPSNMLELNITVRLGVTSYLYAKLEELLQRPQYPSVIDIRALMARYLDEALNIGKRHGGNAIVAWNPDPKIWGLDVWLPPE